jgi:hypothetical protein
MGSKHEQVRDALDTTNVGALRTGIAVEIIK